MIPAQQLALKVQDKDFAFFLAQKNFYKVADTLEKFQQSQVDLKSKQGQEFMAFKRQLYQLFQARHRTVEEHQSFSSVVERQNLKWIYEASVELTNDLAVQNKYDDLANHYYLKGKVYKKQPLTSNHLTSLGCFSAFGLSFWYMPLLTSYLGTHLATLGLTSTLLGGFYGLSQKDNLSSVELLKDSGKVKITVQESLLRHKTYLALPKDIVGVVSLSDDEGRLGYS